MSFIFLVTTVAFAASKTFKQSTFEEFNSGVNAGTRVRADGSIVLADGSATTLPSSNGGWGGIVSPAADDPNYVWVEAEDVLSANANFAVLMANSEGESIERWSNRYGVTLSAYGTSIPSDAMTTSFNVHLPLETEQYFVQVRTDNLNWDNSPTTILLYVDGQLAATGDTTGAGLNWHRLSASIPGGSHSIQLKLQPHPLNLTQELETLDVFLFTTANSYVPPNPTPTVGRLDSRDRFLWLEAEDAILPNSTFQRIMGNSVGYTTERWSNRYGLLFSAIGTLPREALTAEFDVSLPWPTSPFFAYVRTDNQSWNGVPCSIELFVDGARVATGDTTGYGLNWHRLAGTISGGNHRMQIRLGVSDAAFWQVQETLDMLLFTTSSDYAPPNPQDTLGKIVGPTVATVGAFTSSVIDTGPDTAAWHQIAWVEDVPPGTSLSFQTRTGPTLLPDSAWTDWSLDSSRSTGSSILSATNRFIQYRAKFTADVTSTKSPIVKEVRFNADTTATTLQRPLKYGVYTLPGDNASLPGYTFQCSAEDLAEYDFSIIQGHYINPAFGTNVLGQAQTINPAHRVIVRLTGWGDGLASPSLLDYAWDVEHAPEGIGPTTSSMRLEWARQMNEAGPSRLHAVSISEEEPGLVWKGFYEPERPAWMAEYQQQCDAEATGGCSWEGRWTNGLLPWLRNKTRIAFNDVYDWIKAQSNYSSIKVLQFMYTPASGQDFGILNLGPDQSGGSGYKADGWIIQYGFSYEKLAAWLEELHQAQIPNDEIYMQIWGFDPNSEDLIWQTLQARSLGVENVWAFYSYAWIPPRYPDVCDYVALDNDGVADGVIGGVDWLYTYAQRESWESYIDIVRQLQVSIASTVQGSLLVGETATISANASEGTFGQINRVEFFVNDVRVSSDSTAPYSIEWTPGTSGAFRVVAKAFDNYENVASAELPVAVYDLNANLVGLWRFEQNGSDTAPVGTANNGVLKSGMVYDSNRHVGNYSLAFSDSAKQYVLLGNGSDLNPSNALTIAGWFKATDWNGSRRVEWLRASGQLIRQVMPPRAASRLLHS